MADRLKVGVVVADVAHKKVVENRDNRGSCCCGKISYCFKSIKPLWYCHCRQCRQITGHFMAAAQVALDDIKIAGEPKWFYVSESSRHGFCPECGSQLFWRNDKNQFLSVTAGSMHDSSQLQASGHVFAGEKGNYYEIDQNEKRFRHWGDSIEHN